MLNPTFPLVHPFLSHSHSHSHFGKVQCAVWYCNLHVEQLHRLHCNIWGNISGPIKMVGLLSLVTCRTWMRSPQTAVYIADYTGAGPPRYVPVVLCSCRSQFSVIKVWVRDYGERTGGDGPEPETGKLPCVWGGGSRRAPSVHTNKGMDWNCIANCIAFPPSTPTFCRDEVPAAQSIKHRSLTNTSLVPTTAPTCRDLT